MNEGLRTVGAVLTSTHPVFTMIYARLFSWERIGARRWVGIVLTAAGSAVVSIG